MENLYIPRGAISRELRDTGRVGGRSIVSTGEKHGEKKLRKLREDEDVSKPESKVHFRNYYYRREERSKTRATSLLENRRGYKIIYRSFIEDNGDAN